jgi:large subunit ribosomal protein L31
VYGEKMKKDIHPKYRPVVFMDTANGQKFLCASTVTTTQTTEFEGKEYDLYLVAVSSASHPFFTKSSKLIDTEGRIEKFTKRYARPLVADKEEKKEDPKQQKKSAIASKKGVSVTAKKKKNFGDAS